MDSPRKNKALNKLNSMNEDQAVNIFALRAIQSLSLLLNSDLIAEKQPYTM